MAIESEAAVVGTVISIICFNVAFIVRFFFLCDDVQEIRNLLKNKKGEQND